MAQSGGGIRADEWETEQSSLTNFTKVSDASVTLEICAEVSPFWRGVRRRNRAHIVSGHQSSEFRTYGINAHSCGDPGDIEARFQYPVLVATLATREAVHERQ